MSANQLDLGDTQTDVCFDLYANFVFEFKGGCHSFHKTQYILLNIWLCWIRFFFFSKGNWFQCPLLSFVSVTVTLGGGALNYYFTSFPAVSPFSWRCSATKGPFRSGSVHSDICDHSKGTLMQKTSRQRSQRQGDPSVVLFKACRGSFAARAPLTLQTVPSSVLGLRYFVFPLHCRTKHWDVFFSEWEWVSHGQLVTPLSLPWSVNFGSIFQSSNKSHTFASSCLRATCKVSLHTFIDAGVGDSWVLIEVRLNFSNAVYLALAAGSLLKVFSAGCQCAFSQ